MASPFITTLQCVACDVRAVLEVHFSAFIQAKVWSGASPDLRFYGRDLVSGNRPAL